MTIHPIHRRRKYSHPEYKKASVPLLQPVLLLLFLGLSAKGAVLHSWSLRKIFTGSYFTVPLDNQTVPSSQPNKYLFMGNEKTYSWIVASDYLTGNLHDTLINGRTWTHRDTSLMFESFMQSPGRKYYLLGRFTEHLYRHSFSANYLLADPAKKKLTDFAPGKKIEQASFSPDENKIAYVYQRNLYVYDIVSGRTSQATTDGAAGSIINGAVDWVYEEEFAVTSGYAWSPASDYLAYYRFDESAVKEFSFTSYKNQLYPGEVQWKYPKAGEANSKVEVRVYNVWEGSVDKVLATGGDCEYIPRLGWMGKQNLLLLITSNRLQNKLDFVEFNPARRNKRNIYSESAPASYVEIPDFPLFDAKNHMYFTSERSGFNHLYVLHSGKTQPQEITSGKWEVEKLYGLSPDGSKLFLRGNKDDVLCRKVYKVHLSTREIQALFGTKGSEEAIFNNDYSLAMLTASDANTPPERTLWEVKTGRNLRLVTSNDTVRSHLQPLPFSPKQFVRIPGEKGDSLNGYIIYPTGFNSQKKYPVLIHIYGGPGRNMVENRWTGSEMLWQQYMAMRGVIVCSFDGHGTQLRGKDFRASTYGNLGKLECLDMIKAAEYLGKLPYVDAGRIGIQGWSFGGFLSLLSLEKGNNFFCGAVSVAPVTNWRYYDNIYTERYLGLPQQNAAGYDDNSPLNFASQIRGKLFLIHGTADDNVHFQNTAEMVKRLQDALVPFDLMIYPDKNHGISGGTTRLDIYTRISNWWENTFLLQGIFH